MSTVPVYEALFWRGDSPLGAAGEVDVEALAHGLAQANWWGTGPRFYSRAQHAVIVSEAVDTLAGLDLPARSVLATHAWLALTREKRLNGGSRTSGRTRTAWRTMDTEALADALAHTWRWEQSPGLGGGPAPGAAALDDLLARLARWNGEDRRCLSLYALLSETVLTGLGTAVAEAALGTAGLQPSVPAAWVQVLRLIRRMAEAAVRRDLQVGGPGEAASFPALERPIRLLDPAPAGRLWLARYGVLRGGEERHKHCGED